MSAAGRSGHPPPPPRKPPPGRPAGIGLIFPQPHRNYRNACGGLVDKNCQPRLGRWQFAEIPLLNQRPKTHHVYQGIIRELKKIRTISFHSIFPLRSFHSQTPRNASGDRRCKVHSRNRANGMCLYYRTITYRQGRVGRALQVGMSALIPAPAPDKPRQAPHGLALSRPAR